MATSGQPRELRVPQESKHLKMINCFSSTTKSGILSLTTEFQWHRPQPQMVRKPPDLSSWDTVTFSFCVTHRLINRVSWEIRYFNFCVSWEKRARLDRKSPNYTFWWDFRLYYRWRHDWEGKLHSERVIVRAISLKRWYRRKNNNQFQKKHSPASPSPTT